MKTITLSKEQARRFLLRHHGLIGGHRFEGKEGALAYVRQCGCIQFDPIDVCGKNSELVLQSRVKGFSKEVLRELLYEDRALVDYFDKNLAIFPVEDWPYFARERARFTAGGWSFEAVERAKDTVLEMLKEREYLSSRDLDMDEKVSWPWGATRLSRAVLETLYFRGELCIHHKQGTGKFYAPASRLLPGALLRAEDPHPNAEDFRDFLVLRRIGAVGLLWNKASDAWLCVDGLKGGGRAAAFQRLAGRGQIVTVRVEGIEEPLYARAWEEALLREVAGGADYTPRMELIAPLDCLLWDRNLIEKLFGFYYRWEIYTPEKSRQYGYYVLPLLRGDRFVGRVEAVTDRKAGALRLKNVWWEGRKYKGELKKCLKRFADFHGCRTVEGI
ncbi:MAG: winged helix DNA-binding domain-containing protein [Firmicutes bacterium]|nr:winged helix DNA-binding domain-containing protein [Bacillota bacterium]